MTQKQRYSYKNMFFTKLMMFTVLVLIVNLIRVWCQKMEMKLENWVQIPKIIRKSKKFEQNMPKYVAVEVFMQKNNPNTFSSQVLQFRLKTTQNGPKTYFKKVNEHFVKNI